MEKILLKPTSKEILFKGSSKEGHLDTYSYDYDSDESKRKLGGLYMVGNIQSDEDSTKSGPDSNSEETDFTYITNLIASLAKREYYSKPDLSPKEAFSSALKKVNDVVEEFFTNKKLKINIGIFALANENIYISKLGKFKIILARDNKNIDILNSIDLFTKEKVEEKEFSHVISGKVSQGDKILAFYPGKNITTREKTLKESFLKLNVDQFFEKINSIKEEKKEFSCAALCISLDKISEPAIAVKPKEKPTLPDTTPENETIPQLVVKSNKMIEQINHHKTPNTQLEPELPRIIRSEFSLGKKEGPLSIILSKIKLLTPKRKNKIVFFASIIGLVMISTLTFKTLFITSPGEKETANIVKEAKENIKLAKTKISQNDVLSARRLLLGSITGINSIAPSKKSDETKDELIKLLDGLDQASEASPILTEELPKTLKEKNSLILTQKEKAGGISADIYENNLYLLKTDGIFKVADVSTKPKEPTQWLKGGTLPLEPIHLVVDGKVYVINKSGLLTTFYKGEKEKEVNTLILPDESSVLATTKDSKNLFLINKDAGRIYLIEKETGTLLKTIKVSSEQPFTEAYLDQDESIYLVSKDGKIWKVQ